MLRARSVKALLSLSLFVFINVLLSHFVHLLDAQKKAVSLFFSRKLRKAPLFFFLVGAGVLRAIFGAFQGWAFALVACGYT
jgi:hypothetical protein